MTITNTKNNDKIYIACSVDSNQRFQEITATMIYSLAKNLAPDRSAYIYILHDPWQIWTLQSYTDDIKGKFGNIEFQWIWVDKKVFEDKQISTYNGLPLGTYYRLLLPELIDQDKILYLDWDIIVNKDISKLYDIELDNHMLAGIKTNVLKPWMENIQVDNYINAGMMLIDLRWWRDRDVWNKCIEFCAKYPMGLEGKVSIMWDQCAINKICEWNIKYIDPIYNQTPMCFRWDLDYKVLGYDISQYTQAIKNPTIIHFAWVDKPWKANSLHPYNKLWNQYHKELTGKTNIKNTIIQSVTNLWNLNSPVYHSYTSVKNKIKHIIRSK